MTYVFQTALNALNVGSLYAIIAIGVALVFSVMRLVNFAHAGLLMLGGYVVVLLGASGAWLWIPVVIAACGVAALVMERIAFRPLRGADMMTLLVASYSVGMIIQALASSIVGTRPQPAVMPRFFSEGYNIGGVNISNLALITLGACAACLIILGLVLKKTRMGLEMRGAAEDLVMTQLLGVKSVRVIAAAFAISGALAGVAAILLVAQRGSVFPTFGFDYVISAFIACVIGGMGSIFGAAVGGFILGGLVSLLQAALPAGVVGFRDAFVYGLVILLLLWRPQGLFGKVLREA